MLVVLLLHTQGCIYALAIGHAGTQSVAAKFQNYSCHPSGEVVDAAGNPLNDTLVEIKSYPKEPGPTLLGFETGGGSREPSSKHRSKGHTFKARTYGVGFSIKVLSAGFVREEFWWSGKDKAHDEKTRDALRSFGHSVTGTNRSPKFRFVMEPAPDESRMTFVSRAGSEARTSIVFPVRLPLRDHTQRETGSREVGRIVITPVFDEASAKSEGPIHGPYTIHVESDEPAGLEQAHLPSYRRFRAMRYLSEAPAGDYAVSSLLVSDRATYDSPTAFYFRIGDHFGRLLISRITCYPARGTIDGDVSCYFNNAPNDRRLGG